LRSGGVDVIEASATVRWGGRLVQASPGKIAGGACERKIRALSNGTWREGPQQRPDGLSLSVKRQAERAVGQQPRRIGPVTRRLSMPDGVDDLAMLAEPSGGQPVQDRQLSRQPPAQLKPEQVSGRGAQRTPSALCRRWSFG
jgi:hypothetical protein